VDHGDFYEGPLVDRAFDYSLDGPHLKYFNEDVTKITVWLKAQNIDLPARLPERFLQQKGIGCRPLGWSGSKVAIICVDAGVVYHLFVAKEADFSGDAVIGVVSIRRATGRLDGQQVEVSRPLFRADS